MIVVCIHLCEKKKKTLLSIASFAIHSIHTHTHTHAHVVLRRCIQLFFNFLFSIFLPFCLFGCTLAKKSTFRFWLDGQNKKEKRGARAHMSAPFFCAEWHHTRHSEKQFLHNCNHPNLSSARYITKRFADKTRFFFWSGHWLTGTQPKTNSTCGKIVCRERENARVLCGHYNNNNNYTLFIQRRRQQQQHVIIFFFLVFVSHRTFSLHILSSLKKKTESTYERASDKNIKTHCLSLSSTHTHTQ